VEALENAQEAIKANPESLKAPGKPIPPSINEEGIEVAG
jgi:predicted RNase H-like HicB family nuclease